MQDATKYMAPQMHTWAKKQTEGSPLLTRDVLTMMLSQRLYAFTLPDGRILYPMPARSDVSQSLDTIAASPGDTLVRGQNGWEARSGPNGEPVGFTKIEDVTITSPIPHVDLTDLEPYTEIILIGLNVALSASNWRDARVSTDNGATFYSASGDYLTLNTDGTYSSRTDFGGHATSSASPRTCIMHFTRLPDAPGLICNATIFPNAQLFNGSPDPVNAIRFYAFNGQNLTAGRVIAYAR